MDLTILIKRKLEGGPSALVVGFPYVISYAFFMATESRSEKPRALKSLGLSEPCTAENFVQKQGKRKQNKDHIKGEG